MIVIDTSAIIAIVFNEPERDSFCEIIERADRIYIATTTVLETRLVVSGRKGERGVVILNDMLGSKKFEWVAPNKELTDAAYAAFVVFGKGSGHPAALNFGDLFSYALAKTLGLPLLFKGDDFPQTGIERAT
jgi:ribonuclease VapC